MARELECSSNLDNIEIHFDTKEFVETMTYKNSPESSFLAYK